jgi:ligand-binding SRPBCC domain-containing protein
MRIRNLRQELWLPGSIEDHFAFFCNAQNLDAITPPWMHFRVMTPASVKIEKGTLLDYRLRIRGVPVRWQSQITLWDPPHRFVDEQRMGPYKRWIHEHSFETQGGGTLMLDRVDFVLPGGILLEPFVYRLLVGPDLEKIFAFRKSKLKQLFGGAK